MRDRFQPSPTAVIASTAKQSRKNNPVILGLEPLEFLPKILQSCRSVDLIKPPSSLRGPERAAAIQELSPRPLQIFLDCFTSLAMTRVKRDRSRNDGGGNGLPCARKASFISLALLSLFFLESCTTRQGPLTPQVVLAPHQVMVAQGETVYSLAYKNGVSTRALIEANRLQVPYTLLPGQILIIPEREMPKALPIERPLEESAGGPIAIHKSLEPLPLLSGGLPSPERPLAVEPSGPSSLGVKKENVLPSPETLSPKAPPLDPAIARELDLEQEHLAQKKQNPQPARKPSAPVNDNDQKFSWPVQGKVIGNYGRGASGGDGIRIAAPQGTPVHAILKGKVIYAGDEIKNLGNLVLIEHEGGWISAYGCAKELLVKNGDVVAKGQTIAQVGETGDVKQSQLYFEIRKNKKTVDPLAYLRS